MDDIAAMGNQPKWKSPSDPHAELMFHRIHQSFPHDPASQKGLEPNSLPCQVQFRFECNQIVHIAVITAAMCTYVYVDMGNTYAVLSVVIISSMTFSP